MLSPTERSRRARLPPVLNILLAIIQQAHGRSHVGKRGQSQEPYLIIQFRSLVVYSTTVFFWALLSSLTHRAADGKDVSRLESMLSLSASSLIFKEAIFTNQ